MGYPTCLLTGGSTSLSHGDHALKATLYAGVTQTVNAVNTLRLAFHAVSHQLTMHRLSSKLTTELLAGKTPCQIRLFHSTAAIMNRCTCLCADQRLGSGKALLIIVEANAEPPPKALFTKMHTLMGITTASHCQVYLRVLISHQVFALACACKRNLNTVCEGAALLVLH